MLKLTLALPLAVLLGVSAVAQDASESAQANDGTWNICNETSYILRLALATINDEKMNPRGWERLRPGQCDVVETPAGSPRYIYAESDKVHLGGVREWKGDVPLCAADADFSADATISCPLQDLQSRQYMQVNPAESTTTFVEPDNFGKRADIAGIQRLLKDNGFVVARIDGYKGRRTSRPMNKFLKDNKLPGGLTNFQRMDALAKAAEETQSEIGLTVCNQSSEKIWSSVAYRDDGEWESRGWWPVNIGECLRPFTKILKGTEAHYFALQEDNSAAPDEKTKPDRRLKTTAVAPSQFCIAESRFAAAGREYCADRGYIAANFRPLPGDKNGASVSLTDADFVELDPTGLRR